MASKGQGKEYTDYEEEVKGKLQETQTAGKWKGWSHHSLESLESIFSDPEVNRIYPQKTSYPPNSFSRMILRQPLQKVQNLSLLSCKMKRIWRNFWRTKILGNPTFQILMVFLVEMHVKELQTKVKFFIYSFFSFINDQSEYLTIRDDTDAKFDKDKQHNQYLEERIYRWDVCEPPTFCKFAITDGQRGVMEDLPCIFFSWSGMKDIKCWEITQLKFCFLLLAWGDWGQCTSPCHKNGHRERKRVCTNVCTEKVATTEEEKKKCRPFFNVYHNVTVTDTDTAPCTPCPAYGTWIYIFISFDLENFCFLL